MMEKTESENGEGLVLGLGKAPPSRKSAGESRHQMAGIRTRCVLEQAASPWSPERGRASVALGSGSLQGVRIPATTRVCRAGAAALGRPPRAVGLTHRLPPHARQGPSPARSHGRAGLGGAAVEKPTKADNSRNSGIATFRLRNRSGHFSFKGLYKRLRLHVCCKICTRN
jgi:hypothetical protein